MQALTTTRSVITTSIAADGRGRRLVAASLGFTGHQVGEALVPVVIGAVIDRAVATGDSAALGRWILVLGLVFGGLLLSWRTGARLCAYVTEYGAHALRLAVAGKALDPRGHRQRRMPGEVYSIATSDAAGVAYFAGTLSTKLAAVAGVVTTAVALFVISVPLGLLVVLGTPPVLAVMLRLGKPLERRRAADQHEAAMAGALATDLLTGLRVLGGIGAQTNAQNRYRAASRSSLAATMRAERYQVLYSALNVLMTRGFLALIAFVAAGMAVSGSITVGEFIAVVGLAQFLSGPLIDIVYFGEGYARARASGGRIAHMMNTDHAVDDSGVRAAVSTDTLRARRLATPSLHDVDFCIERGEIVGVKTARPAHAVELMDVLARRHRAVSGRVELGGIDITEMPLDDVRAHILTVPHDAALFAGTVRDNLGGGPGGSHGGSHDAALRASGAAQVVDDLPRGVDTVLTEDGLSLSGGQRQRIALARALAADADVLVLHDPTTAVDSVTEALIADGIAEMRRDRITVLLTSSPALLSICTRIVTVSSEESVE